MKEIGKIGCKLAYTPIEVIHGICDAEGEALYDADKGKYQSLVGHRFTAGLIGSDLAYVFHIVQCTATAYHVTQML